jgi:hypothetical protein
MLHLFGILITSNFDLKKVKLGERRASGAAHEQGCQLLVLLAAEACLHQASS